MCWGAVSARRWIDQINEQIVLVRSVEGIPDEPGIQLNHHLVALFHSVSLNGQPD